MNILEYPKKIWKYLKKDTWDSWVVSLILTFVVIKFVFFPLLSFTTGSSLPLVVVESCSMYHGVEFDEWWDRNGIWYEKQGIEKEDFEEFSMKGGLNKGDVVLIYGRGDYNLGDIIVFQTDFKYPLIHRLIDEVPYSTKGDNNFGQLAQEKRIDKDKILGKAVARIPAVGWLKLIFFEGSRPDEQRGFCK